MFSKFLKILFALLVLISVQNCGYQPLLTEKYQKFNINTFDISGDKKLGQMLVNRFVEVKDSENQLLCRINIEKNREISNKDSARFNAAVPLFTATHSFDFRYFLNLFSNSFL